MTTRCDWMEITKRTKDNPYYDDVRKFCKDRGCIGFDTSCSCHPDYIHGHQTTQTVQKESGDTLVSNLSCSGRLDEVKTGDIHSSQKGENLMESEEVTKLGSHENTITPLYSQSSSANSLRGRLEDI